MPLSKLSETRKSRTCQVAGFSLVEVLVSLVLISIIVVGVFNLFSGGKAWIAHRRRMIAAGELGKIFLDPLQMDVRQDQWLNNCLSANVSCPGPSGNYTPSFNSTDVGVAGLRRVRMTVDW